MQRSARERFSGPSGEPTHAAPLASCLLAWAAGVQGAPVEFASAPQLADLTLEQLGNITVTSVSGRPQGLQQAAASIHVITAQDIRRSAATTLPEALRLAPNLQVAQTSSGQWAISARGFQDSISNKLLVLVDGRSLYSPLFAGVFAMLPYYMKVREYSDLENRDLWEYELDFSPEEVERVLRHAWELLPAYFEYYFFDENCSYHLLALLQVARPELDLTAPFRLWALPVDTVRVLTSEPGLVRRIVYRPANSTIIAARIVGSASSTRSTSSPPSIVGMPRSAITTRAT